MAVCKLHILIVMQSRDNKNLSLIQATSIVSRSWQHSGSTEIQCPYTFYWEDRQNIFTEMQNYTKLYDGIPTDSNRKNYLQIVY